MHRFIGSQDTTSSSDVGFYSRYAQKWRHFMQINVKNWTVVAGSVDFLNLSRNSLSEKLLLYSKFFFENQIW